MKVKVLLRIIITIIVLVALGLGTYFIFFKPKDNDAVFVNLTDLVDYKKQENGEKGSGNIVKNKLDIISVNYHNEILKLGDITSPEESTYYSSNANLNYLMNDEQGGFEVEYCVKTADERYNNIKYSVYSCEKLNSYVDKVFDYYFAYSQASEKVTKKAQDEIIAAIKEYKASHKELNEKLQLVISLQKSIIATKGTTVSKSTTDNYALEHDNRLLNAVVAYRNCINKYCNLTLKLKDYVEKFVFNDQIINDSTITQNSISLYSIQMATEVAFGGVSKVEGVENIVANAERYNALHLGSEAKNFLTGFNLNNVKMASKGNILYKANENSFQILVPQTILLNEKDTTAVKIGEKTYARIVSGDGTSWQKVEADAEGNYSIDRNSTETLDNSQLEVLSENAFIKSNKISGTNGVGDLKLAKFVENYTFILNNGYLTELKKILALTNENKTKFMESELGFGIVNLSVDSIRYVLACYGYGR